MQPRIDQQNSIGSAETDTGSGSMRLLIIEDDRDAADYLIRAFREVESSIVAVDRARVRLSDLKRLSASARESAEIARRDYERGILDQLTVLDAQRQSNRADLLLSDGWTASWHAPRLVRGEPLLWQPTAIWGQFNHALG